MYTYIMFFPLTGFRVITVQFTIVSPISCIFSVCFFSHKSIIFTRALFFYHNYHFKFFCRLPLYTAPYFSIQQSCFVQVFFFFDCVILCKVMICVLCFEWLYKRNKALKPQTLTHILFDCIPVETSSFFHLSLYIVNIRHFTQNSFWSTPSLQNSPMETFSVFLFLFCSRSQCASEYQIIHLFANTGARA